MSTKISRIDFRSTEVDKKFIKEAADFSGESMTSFVLSASLEKAEKILAERNVRTLDSEDSRIFYSLLDSMEPAHAKLKAPAKEFEKKYGK